MLLGLLLATPWLAAIAWVVYRGGLELLFPKDDLPVSFGEQARRRGAVR